MKRKIDDTCGDYVLLRTGSEESVAGGYVRVGCRYDDVDLDRPKARELAAILTHFADTGELPGEVGDAKG